MITGEGKNTNVSKYRKPTGVGSNLIGFTLWKRKVDEPIDEIISQLLLYSCTLARFITQRSPFKMN